MEIFPKDESLEKVESLIDDFFAAIQYHVLDSLDTELADALSETLKNVSEMLALKQEKTNLDVSAFTKHAKAVFYMLIRCLGVYSSYRLQGKPEPEHIVSQKAKVRCIFATMH